MLELRTSDGGTAEIPLAEGSVADFHAAVLAVLSRLDLDIRIDGTPNEIPGAVPFQQDHARRTYLPAQAQRFWQALLQVDRVFKRFRSGVLRKTSPVHFFWGSFDLAVTRFSGRRAPLHPGGVAGLPDEITREAYSHELSSAGFWPGGGAIGYPAFTRTPILSHRVFKPPRCDRTRRSSTQAWFLLPYEAARTADDPDAVLLAFLQSTYEAAANAGGWNRAELECPFGEPGVARPILKRTEARDATRGITPRARNKVVC